MKRDKLILLKSALRYFFFCIFTFFGGSVLIKHYFFHEEMDHATITETPLYKHFHGHSIYNRIPFKMEWEG